ncbi:MAG: hypothetical protein JWP37_3169 [Mucilaginibacter sp.]|nr:hypothetical protein [Mucilaginibacter sp.]
MIALIAQLVFLNLIILYLHFVLAKRHDLEQKYRSESGEESTSRPIMTKILMLVLIFSPRSK